MRMGGLMKNGGKSDQQRLRISEDAILLSVQRQWQMQKLCMCQITKEMSDYCPSMKLLIDS